MGVNLRSVAKMSWKALCVLGVACLGAVFTPTTAGAAGTSPAVRSDTVDARIDRYVGLQVQERVGYDFGAAGGQGFVRLLQRRVHVDAGRDRIYFVSDALTPSGDHDELVWRSGLAPHDGLTAVVALPKGVVTAVTYRTRPNPFRPTWPGIALVVLLLLPAAMLSWQRRAPRAHRGMPDGVRPGHAAVLRRGGADRVISVTLHDLAARGHVRITGDRIPFVGQVLVLAGIAGGAYALAGSRSPEGWADGLGYAPFAVLLTGVVCAAVRSWPVLTSAGSSVRAGAKSA